MPGDFLSNFTERSLTPIAEVLPRLPSRFEPVRPVSLGQEEWPQPVQAGRDVSAEASLSRWGETWPRFVPALRPPMTDYSESSAPPSTWPAAGSIESAPHQAPARSRIAGRSKRSSDPDSLALRPTLTEEQGEEHPDEMAAISVQPAIDTVHSSTHGPLRKRAAQAQSDDGLRHEADLSDEAPTLPAGDKPATLNLQPISEMSSPRPSLAESAQLPVTPVPPVPLVTVLPRPVEAERQSVLPKTTMPVEPVSSSDGVSRVTMGPALTRSVQSEGAARPPAIAVQPPSPTTVMPAARLAPALPIERRDAPQPAPTISVTIGRVEIRASAAPAAPAKTASAKGTPMSLDEYLRQSAKRGSR